MTETIDTSNITSRLQALADKQAEWRALPAAKKLEFLERAKDSVVHEVGLEGLKKMVGEPIADMKKVQGAERDVVVAEEVMIMSAYATEAMECFAETYRVLAGLSDKADKETLLNVPTRKAHGHVIADAFPLTKTDKAEENPFHDCAGEVWFDPDTVKEVDQAKPLQMDANGKMNKEGVLVVLGAGNYSMLTVIDAVHALFMRNRTTFVKHHPARACLDKFMRVIFASLFEAGYLDSEVDKGIQACEELVYHPLVSSVHMTGGVATHDAIVWGKTKEEQAINKANNTPRLKQAEMTSELGCVTPYIMTPAKFTNEELLHQAKTLIGGKHGNGSASCNAPQVVVLSKSWPQREDFVKLLKEAWGQTPMVPTWYPGSGDRWKSFQKAYQGSAGVQVVRNSNSGVATEDIDESHLPLLMIPVEVNLDTEEGRKKAKSEYGFLNEAFCPVLIIATVEDGGSTEGFLAKSVDLSNNYLIGSLSCSVAVPTSAEKSEAVEQALAELKYGAVVTNAWSALSYGFWRLGWGGILGETLDAVESGIGKVGNCLGYANVEKCICRSPTIHPMHFDFCKSNEEIAGFYNFVADMTIKALSVPKQE